MFSFERLRFYITHSINDLVVSGQRTLFGLFCIAAGVAAIVGLLTLGDMVENTLTGSLQESNRGDIRIAPEFVFDDEESSGDDDDQSNFDFTPQEVDAFIAWFAERENVPIEDNCTDAVNLCVSPQLSFPGFFVFHDDEQNLLQSFAVDTQTYPLYGTIETEQGQTLAEAIDVSTYAADSDVADAVISENLSEQLDLNVGEEFNILGSSKSFIVRGIVPTRTEGGFENLLGGIFGYVYLDNAVEDSISFFDEDEAEEIGFSQVYVRLENPSDVVAIGEAFSLAFPNTNVTTTEDLREANEDLSVVVTQFNSIMGLLSLLIGGIGIVNTMLVLVRRRTGEVAILKTIGLEPGEVSTLFFVESIIMGIIGSIIGIPFGFLIAFFTRGAFEAFVAQDLPFRITPEPIVIGLIVGTLITTIFGLLPTLSAGQVRPSSVLNPQASNVPKAGISRSVFALVFIIIALSFITQGLLRDLLTGDDLDLLRTIAQFSIGVMSFIAGAAMVAGGIWYSWTLTANEGLRLLLRILRWGLLLGVLPIAGFILGQNLPAVAVVFAVFIIAVILYLLLWVIVWVIGRFMPTFRIVDLRIAMRSMLAAKGRVASTLLAFIIGVFTLSLTVMLVTTISDVVENLVEDIAGGNIIAFTVDEDILGGGNEDGEAPIDSLQNALDAGISGVESYGIANGYNATLVSFTDVSRNEILTRTEMSTALQNDGYDVDAIDSFFEQADAIDARSVNETLPDVQFTDGRQLAERDAFEQALVIPDSFEAQDLGIQAGDQLTYRFIDEETGSQSEEITFTIVGVASFAGIDTFGNPYYTSLDFLPAGQEVGVDPSTSTAIVNAIEGREEDVARELRRIDNVLVIETRLFNDIVNRLLETFTTLPIVVSIVVLITGGVVIANSVALSMLERRREIAIMKAVGLQRRRVLGMLLLENGIMGFIAGLIGVGISALILFAMLVLLFNSELGEAIPITQALLLMGMCIAIAMVAAIVSVWGAASEKPLNVLRHE